MIVAILLCLALLIVPAQAQAPGADSVSFTYEKVNDRPEEVLFVVTGDTLDFQIYYVETMCADYDYRLTARHDSLIVAHVNGDSASCEGDGFYGVKGRIWNLRSGRYRFILTYGNGKKQAPIFKETVRVP
jgi:hypothetical protein